MELLVVVAIIGILSAVGVLSYNGYISGTQKKSAINIMQQILLAQTEEYSNSNSYKTSGCSDSINSDLFGGSDIVADVKEIGYTICLEDDDDVDFKVVATSGECILTLPRIGKLDESEDC